ncbi:Wzz/FepE/Etk N-terminal domain-containing protein [Emcibacteraceae bacterium]|nr:Wzz/FepE/Etk N-terminal domain-containing protein [Emcibacteraceae bacterium]
MLENHQEHEINLLDLIRIIKKRWLWITIVSPIVGVLTFFILTFIPNTYVSTVMLTKSDSSEQTGSSNKSGLSAVGAIAGFDLGGAKDSNVYVAIEIIKSRKFAIDFVKKHNLEIELFAIKGWDGENYIVDNSIYDTSQKKWVRDVKPPLTAIPQDWEIYDAFSELLSIVEDENGFIIITIENLTPVIVKQWLEWIVEDINSIMKVREQNELERSINFLQTKLATVELQEIRQIFSSLLEEQTRKLMMTESRLDFVLEILDPPYEPAVPSKPKRLLIILPAIILSAILTGIIVIIYELNRNISSTTTQDDKE